ncbi:M42 family metallopeptidase [Peribacillus frigoritolerans]|uniref:M42 family metallopeptidase n=1 Tax=Peribacillus frigoritolerans TaxID=450367 RepID=UPI0022828EA0|nr:M42 family peptidase [Peribacillus frigoritolerans]MCY8939721.1 M42 family peptidase [Peribacillus frigoritolerans]
MKTTNMIDQKAGHSLREEKVKESIKNSLRDLTGLVGVSGSEQEVVKYMRDNLLQYADEVDVDRNGNVIAIKKGNAPGPKLMISSHSDEVGFCVKNILPNGFIMFDKVGGVSDQLLLGRKVWVTTKKLPGIIGIKAGHMQTPEESKRVKTTRECYIDVGASSRMEVEDMGIKVGDPIVFQSDFMEMVNKDLVCTKSVDNRIHCAILIELFKELQGVEFAGTLYGVVTVQEEVGLLGAIMVGNAIEPDYAIVLDTIPAGDTPDIDTEISLPVYLGKGPACPIADGVRGTMVFNHIHPKVREIIEEQAAKANVSLQMITLVGDAYTTDAASLTSANKGIPVGVLSTPRRYSHSPVELVNLNDAEGVLKIAKGIVLDNGGKDLGFI